MAAPKDKDFISVVEDGDLAPGEVRVTAEDRVLVTCHRDVAPQALACLEESLAETVIGVLEARRETTGQHVLALNKSERVEVVECLADGLRSYCSIAAADLSEHRHGSTVGLPDALSMVHHAESIAGILDRLEV